MNPYATSFTGFKLKGDCCDSVPSVYYYLEHSVFRIPTNVQRTRSVAP